MAIGEAVLGAFLQVVFDKLVFSPGVKKLLKLRGGGNLDATMKQWKCQLERFREMADDAEEKQFYNDRVKTWVDDIRDLAYDIEDILDDFAEEAQSHEFNNTQEDDADDSGFFGSINNMRRNIADPLSTMFSPINPDIQSRVDGITARLQDIQTRTQNLGLMAAYTIQQQTLQAEAFRKRRESTSLVAEPEVFGRDEQKEHIITQLLKDEQSCDNYVVVPIVGQGGIGKTTLAQYVYNDEQVKSHFKIKAWVCVSDVFDVKCITTTIINSVDNSKFDFSNLNLAQEKLMELLTDRRFFIVLDDVWSENYDDWSQLRTPFRYGAKGSRVVMTTRNEKIACMMVTKHISINTLNGLSSDDCWHIFQQHTNEDTDLAEMREDIVQKCNGLPLAAKALAGLLRKKSKSECRRILNSNIWSEKSSVLPVLRLSYHHLPSRVKCCFAYCSVLPKDYRFEEMEIIQLWMAQGFLTDKSERMEDIGHDIFRDLVSISLFEKHNNGKYLNMEFTMHDLIHDLAKWAAGSLCCVTNTMHLQRDVERTRHLYVTENGIDETLGTQLSTSPLRTFLYGKYTDLDVEILDYIPKFRYLRTLSLVSGKIEELPKSIGDFKHLQFLELRLPKIRKLPESTGYLKHLRFLKITSSFEELPESIGDLKHLRSLELRSSNIKVLPNSIGKLTSLRTLHVDFRYKIEEFPDVSNLLELSHLFVSHCSSGYKMLVSYHSCHLKPCEVCEVFDAFGSGFVIMLRDVKVWNEFVLAAGGGSRIRDLKKLNKLHGRLEIYGVANVIKVEDAQEAQLHKKTSLEELCLYWQNADVGDDDNTAKDVLEQLKPHTFIKKYELIGYKGLTLPCWLGDPSFKNIVVIMLLECMRCECFPSLGQLRSLKSLSVLWMGGIKEVGLEFYGDCSTPPFPALTSLVLIGMLSWEKWEHSPVDNNRAFTRLEQLTIAYCRLQKDIPPHLPALKELKIERCEEMSVSLPSLPSLEKLVIDGCKELSIMADISICSGSIWLRNISEMVSFPCLGEKLNIVNCENMESLPSQLHHFSSLQTLTIAECPKIKCFPEGGLPKNLTHLYIGEMKIEQPVQEWGLDHCESLETLNLLNVGSCTESLDCIPCPGFSLPGSLDTLRIKNFQNFKRIASHCILPNLTVLEISDCPNLEFLGGDLITSLKSLQLESCPKLESLFDENVVLTSLRYLFDESLFDESLFDEHASLTTLQLKNCPNLKFLSGQFASLGELVIKNCRELRSFPKACLSQKLRWLRISTASIETPIKEWGLHLLTSLYKLEIKDVGNSSDTLECTTELHLPSSLTEFYIKGFKNLKTIPCSTLPKLFKVSIKCCPKFESFGDNGLHSQLFQVLIEECELIQQKLKRDPKGRIYINKERYSFC